MQDLDNYLGKTESAVRILFDGIESYLSILRAVSGVTFTTGQPYGPEQDAEFESWRAENAERLVVARQAEKRFAAESFALDTLCGAVLQVADKAIELYSRHTSVPHNLSGDVGPHLAKFCIGRHVRSVPLGMVIYGGRNQHTHFDETLRRPSARVFGLLATEHGYGTDVVDPAFDLANPGLVSYAGNVTALIEWRSYEQYERDMRAMLQAPRLADAMAQRAQSPS